jgi:hypothetical protein
VNGALVPFAAHAGDLVDEAARALAHAQQVDWVSDAADRYRATLAEAQQAVLRARALIATARQALALHDAASAQARDDLGTRAAQRLLGDGGGTGSGARGAGGGGGW